MKKYTLIHARATNLKSSAPGEWGTHLRRGPGTFGQHSDCPALCTAKVWGCKWQSLNRNTASQGEERETLDPDEVDFTQEFDLIFKQQVFPFWTIVKGGRLHSLLNKAMESQ